MRALSGFVLMLGLVIGSGSTRAMELTNRASVGPGGVQGDSDSARAGIGISTRGGFISFGSAATNLVPGDTNGFSDAFVRVRDGGTTTTRVSVGLGGAEANGGLANDAEVLISADGRIVAFCSDATNLVAGDTNGVADLFAHDRRTGLTERLTVSSSGAQADKGSLSRVLGLSADGRFVLFRSDASNLVPGDTNQVEDVFVRDRRTKRTERVNVSSAGAQADGPTPTLGGISADGRYVTFSSSATNLVPGSAGGLRAFVRDRERGETELVSGTLVDASDLSLSGDGRFVAFSAANGGVSDIFVHDRATTAIKLVSAGFALTPSNGDSGFPTISKDGRYIAFVSDATNLVRDDANGTRDVFARDLSGGEIIRASVGVGGPEANGPSFAPVIAPAGYYLAFVSDATNLVPRDTNGLADVFAVRDVFGGSYLYPNPYYSYAPP